MCIRDAAVTGSIPKAIATPDHTNGARPRSLGLNTSSGEAAWRLIPVVGWSVVQRLEGIFYRDACCHHLARIRQLLCDHVIPTLRPPVYFRGARVDASRSSALHDFLSATRAAGFTSVEVILSITIIGILVVLLLPAIRAARQAAHRVGNRTPIACPMVLIGLNSRECAGVRRYYAAVERYWAMMRGFPDGNWASDPFRFDDGGSKSAG